MAKIEGGDELGDDNLEAAVRSVLLTNPDLKKQLIDNIAETLAGRSNKLVHTEEAKGYTEEELSEMNMPQIWKICREFGLSKKGRKPEVIKRILKAQEAPPEE